jgi:hypothetical protein
MPQYTPEPLRAVTTAPGDQFSAYSAQFANGGHVVVWNSGDASNPQGSSVFAQVYDAQGNPVGGPFQLFTGAEFATDGALAGGLAALPDGSFVVVARSEHLDTVNHTPAVWNFYQERVSAAGQVLSGPALVASYDSFNYPSAVAGPVHVSPDGSGYHVEIDLVDRPIPYQFRDISLRGYDLNGAAVGQEIHASGMDFKLPDGAVLAGGHVVTVSAFGLYTLVVNIDAYDANGTSVGHAEIGGTSNYGVADERSPEIAALADGNALLVWLHQMYNGQTQWFSQVVDPTGHLVGDRQALQIPTSTSTVHLTSLAGGGVLAWWDSGSGYVAQHLDENGVADSVAVPISASLPTVTATADGGFLVESVVQGADSGKDVYEQKFDATSISTPGHIDVSGNGGLIPAGNFAISGSAGLDTISFASPHTAYAVTQTSVAGPEGIDTLTGIERVHFGDGYAVALDVNGDAGQAYRLYQAAFDRAPDLPGLGFHINDLDNGLPLWAAAQHFVESPEFQAKYGSAVDDTQFITLLYRNVLNREPEAAGLQFHLDEFAQGETRADMLTHFSESPENQIHVIGQIVNGMLYVPLA